MRAAVRLVAAAAVAAGVAAGGAAQPPGGDNPRERKGQPAPKREDVPGPRGGPGAPGRPEANDPQLDGWIKVLVEKMNDPHDAIRESARAALVAVGPPAIPTLAALAGGSDAKAFSARRLIQQIEQHAAAPRFDGPRGGPQPPPGPGRGRDPGDGPPLGRILGQLDLTDAQRGQVTKLVEGYADKMREVLEKTRDGKLDRGELRDHVGKMSAEATAELRRILTPDQIRRFDQLAPAGRPLFPTPGQEDAPPPARPLPPGERR